MAPLAMATALPPMAMAPPPMATALPPMAQILVSPGVSLDEMAATSPSERGSVSAPRVHAEPLPTLCPPHPLLTTSHAHLLRTTWYVLLGTAYTRLLYSLATTLFTTTVQGSIRTPPDSSYYSTIHYSSSSTWYVLLGTAYTMSTAHPSSYVLPPTSYFLLRTSYF